MAYLTTHSRKAKRTRSTLPDSVRPNPETSQLVLMHKGTNYHVYRIYPNKNDFKYIGTLHKSMLYAQLNSVINFSSHSISNNSQLIAIVTTCRKKFIVLNQTLQANEFPPSPYAANNRNSFFKVHFTPNNQYLVSLSKHVDTQKFTLDIWNMNKDIGSRFEQIDYLQQLIDVQYFSPSKVFLLMKYRTGEMAICWTALRETDKNYEVIKEFIWCAQKTFKYFRISLNGNYFLLWGDALSETIMASGKTGENPSDELHLEWAFKSPIIQAEFVPSTCLESIAILLHKNGFIRICDINKGKPTQLFSIDIKHYFKNVQNGSFHMYITESHVYVSNKIDTIVCLEPNSLDFWGNYRHKTFNLRPPGLS